MSEPPPIIEYARAAFDVAGAIQIRRAGDQLTITIPPPPFWRSLTLALLRGSALITLFAIAAFLFYMLNGTPGAVFPLAIPCALLPALIIMLIRVTRVALAGSQPTIIRASPLGLQIAPRGMAYRNCNWIVTELADVGVRQTGLFPAFTRNIQLQVILTGDRVETHTIAWNGTGALANIEDNLRDVLALHR